MKRKLWPPKYMTVVYKNLNCALIFAVHHRMSFSSLKNMKWILFKSIKHGVKGLYVINQNIFCYYEIKDNDFT